MPSNALVIGGGFQGVTAALALAERGVSSTIVEAASSLFTGASVGNEGKIHLGFVYALDSEGETADRMVEGALSFSPLFQRWCGPLDWESIRSQPFAYAVMPGSLATAAELEEYYGRVMACVESRSEELGSDYCGFDPRVPVRRGTGAPPGMDSASDLAWFQTPEVSIDPRALMAALERAMAANPLIEVLVSHRVVDVEQSGDDWTLICGTPDGTKELHARQVLNCAWQQRPALDSMAGVEPERLIYRIKHTVIARSESPTPPQPLTLVQGPFGDIVAWSNGDLYLNWYPATRTFIGPEPTGDCSPDPAVADAALREMQNLIPPLDEYEVVDNAAYWILAPDPEHATSDISVDDSPLHKRSGMGMVEHDGWWSIRSYKLTTAPLASDRCAAQVAEALGAGTLA